MILFHLMTSQKWDTLKGILRSLVASVHVKEERKMTETVFTALASKPMPQQEVQSKTELAKCNTSG